MYTRIITASFAVATLLGLAQDASAQRRQQGIDIDFGPIRIEIGEGDGRPGPRPEPRPEPRPRPNVEYVVKEFNPITGGLYNTKTFAKQSDANAYRDTVARVHWVKWRFAGINEPLRSRRFANSRAAQQFIDSDGPSKTGKAGFAILTNETGAVPARTGMSIRQVQN
jgi:hypothetical protein